MRKEQSQIALPNPWIVFTFEALMFSLTLALGILAGWRLRQLVQSNTIGLTPVSVWQLFFSFVVATLALLLVAYFLKFQRPKRIFFKIILWGTVILGNLFFWSLWLSDGLILVLTAILVWALIKKPFIWVYNLAIIFAAAGVASSLGIQLTPLLVCLMMLVFSIYDFVAVHLTGHMIKMAKEMVNQQVVIGLVIPKTIQEFKSPIKEIQQEGKFMILGGGDVVFPLLLAISCLSINIWSSVLVAAFSLVGLLAVFLIFINQKERRPLPALPPIALVSIVGYFITTLLW
ncbi:MAG: presenilin family intramembrane aspartyl protease [Candidatus Pacebacteria bacterium]|nr:presenilin family intramembrane aspartyl protease [Candidatus Paceibacterota bacterium]